MRIHFLSTEADGKSNWTLQPDYKLHLSENAKTIYCGRAYIHEQNEAGVQGAKSVSFALELDDNPATAGINTVEGNKKDNDNVLLYTFRCTCHQPNREGYLH